MKRFPIPALTLILAAAFLTATSGGCFKKGEGKGKRKSKPSPASTGDIFVPGPGAKPGVPKDNTPAEMDPQARSILASCFGIPESEVENVPGWTDAAAAVSAANALCAQLANVGYNKGTVSATAAPVDIQ
jgi:hypothetical protein